VLLVGYPPHSLYLTTEGKTWTLQDDKEAGDLVSASMSADGTIVASAHRIPGDPFTRAPRLIVSTYSTADLKWTDRDGLEVLVGKISISPDGTRLACVTREMPGVASGMRILNLKTGEITVGPKLPERSGSGVSWSPDSRRIAFNKSLPGEDSIHTLYVWNVQTGAISRLASGMAPSWSPSGEWIAFIGEAGKAHSGEQYLVKLIHPDGTGVRVLTAFHSDVVAWSEPVWSPDSKTLLINVSRNPDKDTWDIFMLDLATLKFTKRFKNTTPVFGWVAAR
jgi:WD40 repeat protein